MFPKTANPLVIRTDFENQQAWDAICGLIRAPVQEGSDTFLAFVEFLEATHTNGRSRVASRRAAGALRP
jgi:hypothetical protein